MKRYEKYKDSGVEWIGEIPGNLVRRAILRNRAWNSGSRVYIQSGMCFISSSQLKPSRPVGKQNSPGADPPKGVRPP